MFDALSLDDQKKYSNEDHTKDKRSRGKSIGKTAEDDIEKKDKFTNSGNNTIIIILLSWLNNAVERKDPKMKKPKKPIVA